MYLIYHQWTSKEEKLVSLFLWLIISEVILSRKYVVAAPLFSMLFIKSLSFGLRLEWKDVRNIPSIDKLVSLVHLLVGMNIL